MNVLGNATTYGIYIFRAFVPSRFLMGFWLSTFVRDVSRWPIKPWEISID
jgi:hypothetical protein